MSKPDADVAEILLMNQDRVQRSVNRMAYQIAEENRDKSDIVVIGLKERGYVIARMLVNKLTELTERKVALRRLLKKSKEGNQFENQGEEFHYLVLVDDVIFSGQTMFRAIQQVMSKDQPRTVRVAVLVDRGHRNVPVEAAFVGLALPTKLNEHVEVQIESAAVKKVVLNNSTN